MTKISDIAATICAAIVFALPGISAGLAVSLTAWHNYHEYTEHLKELRSDIERVGRQVKYCAEDCEKFKKRLVDYDALEKRFEKSGGGREN